jgi:hypothetical protein
MLEEGGYDLPEWKDENGGYEEGQLRRGYVEDQQQSKDKKE